MAEGRKICHLMDKALDLKVPIIALIDSGGARIQEGCGRADRIRPPVPQNLRRQRFRAAAIADPRLPAPAVPSARP